MLSALVTSDLAATSTTAELSLIDSTATASTVPLLLIFDSSVCLAIRPDIADIWLLKSPVELSMMRWKSSLAWLASTDSSTVTPCRAAAVNSVASCCLCTVVRCCHTM